MGQVVKGAIMETWSHKLVRAMPYKGKEYGPNARIRVTAGLHKLEGNARPYFSVTGEIFIPGKRDAKSCGCIHEEILRHWPELAPVVALHLSDDSGTPMHAEANGWYWLAGFYGGAGEQYHGASGSCAKTPEQCLEVFAKHVRVSLGDAREWAKVWRGKQFAEDARPAFALWLARQSERFQSEADLAVDLLDSMSTLA
jgi:hypothetical protein